MSENIIFLEIAGGIFLILYGIHLSGTGLQKVLGSKLEEVLKKAKGNPLKGLAIGALSTGAIHSSSTTAVMLIGLITGSFMGLGDTIPIILGADVGSTIATQLASLRVGWPAFIILIAGVWIHMAATKKLNKQIGEVLIGFSFIFLGAQYVFAGSSAVAHNEGVLAIAHFATIHPILSILCGAIATVILRSASVISILVVGFGSAGIFDLSSALFIILGINLGSSLKVVHLALGGKNFSGRIAFIHLMSNLLGLTIFLIFFSNFQTIIALTSGDTARQIANAHTLYNLVSALIFIPFIPIVIRLTQKMFPESNKIKKEDLFYLDRKLMSTPSVSLMQVNRGAIEMTKISCEMLESSKEMFFERKNDSWDKINEQEDKIDDMTEKITDYTIGISQQNLSKDDTMILYSFMHIVADIEHLCDHIVALAKILKNANESGIIFPEKPEGELSAVYGKLRIMQNLVIKSLSENNIRLAKEITEHENKVDEIIKKIAANHQKRIDENQYSEETGKYFSDILYNLERIGDHYDNISYAIIDRFRSEDRK